MQRLLSVVTLVVLLALGASPAGAAQGQRAPLYRATGEAADGRYIVVLDEGRDPLAVTGRVAVAPHFVYREALSGFAATLDAAQLERVRRHPHVAYVEEDQVVTPVYGEQHNPPSWGLDRVDQRQLPLDNLYHWNSTAPDAHAYVFDTGIETGHWDFGGRARVAYDVFGGNGQDCHGHGTHVAGTLGGKAHGVAREVNLWSVRVLDCGGSGTWSGVIATTDHIAGNHRKPAVANYSLGGGYSAAANAAIDRLSAAGVFVAVAAGNSGDDACFYSPASAESVFTTAASDRYDYRPWWSNYGLCVDGYAPGVQITSAWLNGGTATLNGTSMASPHVAGTGALYKALMGEASSETVKRWVIMFSTPDVIRNNPPNTPSRLVYAPLFD